MLVDIIVYDGLDELDALGPLEVLRSAERLGAPLTARLAVRCPPMTVEGGYGLRFLADTVYRPGEADALFVPGGSWAARAERGAWGEARRGDWLPLLAEGSERASATVGVCSGTMLLAEAGVVGSRRAATHHTAREDLGRSGAVVVEDRVVDDGDLVTSGGVTSGIDAALWFVEREAGTGIADRVATRMEYRRARPQGPTRV